MANKKDFAVGTVANAPGTAGTSLVLDAGYGQTMPTPPFYLTLSPSGQLTTLGNAEKVLVTARPGGADTFTITRAQGNTTAKNVQAGWIAVNGVYTDDIESVSLVTGETPVGSINGVNASFTTASSYITNSLKVFKNGIRLKGAGNDYTEVAGGFTMVAAPATGTVLVVDYTTSTTGVYSQGSNSTITDEVPSGTKDGTNLVFTTTRAYIGGTLEVHVNGIKQRRGADFTETSTSAGTFTFATGTAPASTDDVFVNYQFNLNPASNADTVDGIHANITPTANQLVPLGSNSKFAQSTIPGIAFRARRNTNYNSTANNQTSGFSFDLEQYDYGSCYDPSTGLFTAPYNGVYSFDASFFTEAAATTRAFIVPRGTVMTDPVVDGSETGTRALDISLPTGSSVNRTQAVFEFYMNAGQTFGVDVWTSAVNNLNHPDTWFAGHLVMAV